MNNDFFVALLIKLNLDEISLDNFCDFHSPIEKKVNLHVSIFSQFLISVMVKIPRAVGPKMIVGEMIDVGMIVSGTVGIETDGIGTTGIGDGLIETLGQEMTAEMGALMVEDRKVGQIWENPEQI